MKSVFARVWKLLKLPKGLQLFVMRFLPNQFLVGVTGVIFNEKNEVLLFKHTYRQHSWSLPGGYLKAGEHPAEALEREIKEESHLVVSIDNSLKIRTDRTGARLDMCYTGKFIGGEFTPSQEVSGYGFFSQNTMPLLRSNQVFLIEEGLQQKKIKNNLTQSCSQCGVCCRLFLINLTKKEWGSHWYQTELKEFEIDDNFEAGQKYGGNILSQKKDGSCIYLKKNLCSIHQKRPQVCRDFSCLSKSKKFEGMIGIIISNNIKYE